MECAWSDLQGQCNTLLVHITIIIYNYIFCIHKHKTNSYVLVLRLTSLDAVLHHRVLQEEKKKDVNDMGVQ